MLGEVADAQMFTGLARTIHQVQITHQGFNQSGFTSAVAPQQANTLPGYQTKLNSI